jgi:hypothetical protein
MIFQKRYIPTKAVHWVLFATSLQLYRYDHKIEKKSRNEERRYLVAVWRGPHLYEVSFVQD